MLAIVSAGIVGCTPPTVPALPSAGPQVLCQGVPDSVCNQAIATVGENSRGPVAQLVVRCSKPICTERLGEADVLMVFVDGRREVSNFGWSSAEEAPIPVITPPTLTVVPVCQGVPLERCNEFASSIDPEEELRPIGSITVRCNGVCTPEVGQGQTIVQHMDGTADTVVDWAYGGGG